jgi:hypothetical protein
MSLEAIGPENLAGRGPTHLPPSDLQGLPVLFGPFVVVPHIRHRLVLLYTPPPPPPPPHPSGDGIYSLYARTRARVSLPCCQRRRRHAVRLAVAIHRVAAQLINASHPRKPNARVGPLQSRHKILTLLSHPSFKF